MWLSAHQLNNKERNNTESHSERLYRTASELLNKIRLYRPRVLQCIAHFRLSVYFLGVDGDGESWRKI